MCGIGAFVSSSAGGFASNTFEAFVSSLTHRGPDDSGIIHVASHHRHIALAQTRLSIIDLSPGGHQPFTDPSGIFTVVFNGEIYNYLELRRELEGEGLKFTTQSDTEVLLNAWIHWGETGLDRLRGMFAFLVVNRENHTLTAVRDAYGIKPLYWHLGQKGVGFASEIRALEAFFPAGFGVNNQVLFEFLTFGLYDRSEETFFESVYSLAPGSIAKLDYSQPTLTVQTRVWSSRPETLETVGLSFEEGKKLVKTSLSHSVELHLRADVGLGVALSGGVDSSILAALVRDQKPREEIHTFSFGAPGSDIDESRWSRLVAEHLQTEHHVVEVSGEQLTDDLDDLIRSQGEPFGSPSIYAQYAVYRAAHDSGFKVMLDGQGADEIFAGYRGYPEFRLRSYIANGEFSKATGFINGWSTFPGHHVWPMLGRALGTYLPRQFAGAGARLFGRSPRPPWISVAGAKAAGIDLNPPVMYGYPLEGPPTNRQLIHRLSAALFSGDLNNLLRHGDRNSMRWSVESRVPFLNQEVITASFGLPEEHLLSPTGQTKAVLREAARGLLPDEILDRKDKVGFRTPELEWLRGAGKNADYWLEGLENLGWVNYEAAQKLVEGVLTGSRPYSPAVWRLICAARWIKLCVSSK